MTPGTQATKLAILAEPDLTGRRRAHRAPKPPKRDTAGVFDDLKPGDYVVLLGAGNITQWANSLPKDLAALPG